MVKQLNLSDITNQLPNQISGGQKQRVAIAKTIYTNPSIILADEPTASLDTNNAMAVMKILQEQTKERNKTCVIVTHDERLTHFVIKHISWRMDFFHSNRNKIFTITCISYLKFPSQHLL